MNADNATKVAMLLKKINIALMRHPEYKWMAGMFVSGTVEITDSIPTASTDGWNEKYNPDFMAKHTTQEMTFIRLHEALHKFLKHGRRFRAYEKAIKAGGSDAVLNFKLANVAMDYVINAMINSTKDKTLVSMPKSALYDAMFDNMGWEEVYSLLKKNIKQPQPQPGQGQGQGTGQEGRAGQPQQGQPGQGQPQDGQGGGQGGGVEVEIDGKKIRLDGFDDHDGEGTGISEEQEKEIDQKIERALQQGAILAGIMGQDLPRAVRQALEVPVRWDAELEEFVTSSCANRDDYSYRRLDRRWLGSNDDMLIMPTLMQENIAEVMIAADASGSIGDEAMGKWLETVARICEAAQPDVIRVVFWDMNVRSEQVFDRSQISEITKLMKPRGGGGTRVGCVSDYIRQRSLTPDCLIVLTDGWVEHDVQWGISTPVLWTVTENAGFRPPAGRVVKINN